MVDKTVIPVEVTSNGTTDNEIKKADKLSAAYKLAAASAASVRTPAAVVAAKGGVANAAAAKQGQQAQDSNTARGIGGMTGAAGRDFAAQAQGLGGLVHVYATFAANLFAITAAFGALSKAADTTNMIKGLDQLGAASGRGLGSLAKQLTAVTDGAISLRDAMTATAQASAGGMSGENILRLGKVAKQASQALGIDMPNAVSRLSRGITKLEPELLDELGIMVRVDRASEAYALKLGKATSALTDFEKRQGFANAVLEQGEQKFGAIQLNANPYSKILASTENLLQSGLELVNKFFGPLLAILSTSPTALATVLGGIATILLKQAIPAIGMFRQNAKIMAEEAHKRVVQQVKDQQEAAVRSDVIASTAAEISFQREKNTIERISKLKKTTTNKDIVSEASRQTIKGGVFAASPEQMAALKKESDILLATTDDTLKKQGEKLAKYYASADKLRQENTARGDAAAQANEQRDNKWYSHQEQLTRNLEKLNRASAKRIVLSGVADTAATLGPAYAFKQLREEVGKLDAGKVSKGFTMLQGSISIATSAATTAINAFGVWAQVIGLVVAAVALLDGWLSTSSKQAAEFATSVESLNATFDNIGRTLEDIARKPLLQQLSVESVQAKANALGELNGALKTTVFNFGKLQEAQSGWDKFFDGFWDLFGKGSGDILARGISSSVVNAFKVMDEGPAKDAAKKSLQNLLGKDIDFTNIDNFNAKIKDLDKSKIGEIGKNISSILDKANNQAGNAAAALTEAKAAMSNVNLEFDKLTISVKLTDEFTKMGTALNEASLKIGTALRDPINGLVTLRDLAADMKTMSFLPAETSNSLANSRKELEKLSIELQLARNNLRDISNEKVKLASVKGGGKVDSVESQVRAAQAQLDSRKNEAKSVLVDLEAKNKDALSKWAKVSIEIFQKGLEYSEKGLAKSLSEAAIIAAKGYTDIIKSAGGNTAVLDASLQNKTIDLQIRDLEARYANTNALQLSTLASEANTLALEKSELRREIENKQGKGLDTTALELTFSNIEKAIKENALASTTAKAGPGAVLALNRQFGGKNANSNADSVEFGAVRRLGPATENARGLQGQLAIKSAEKLNIELNKRVNLVKEEYNDRLRILDLTTRTLNIQQNDIKNIESIDSMYNSIVQAKKEELRISQIYNDDEKKLLANEREIASLRIAEEAARKNKDVGAVNAAIDARAKLTVERTKQEAELRDNLNANSIKNIKERTAGEKALAEQQISDALKLKDAQDSLISARESSQTADINYRKAIGTLSESNASILSTEIELSAQQRNFDKESLALVNAKNLALADINGKLEIARSLAETTESKAKIADLEAEKAKIIEISGVQRDALNLQNESRIKAINLLEEQNQKLIDQANIVEQLNVLFGNIGVNLFEAVKALQLMAETDSDYLRKKTELTDKLKDSNDPEENTNIAIQLAKLETKHTKDQLLGISSVAKSTKKMFSEKTAAYKAFSAIEKVTSAISMALQVKEMAVSLAALPGKIANGVAELFDQGGWAGFAGAAAFLALMGSLGGKSASVPQAGMTAEDMQKSQGTGQSWVGGKLTDNGGGTFGDTSAKSESIVNSLEIIRDNTLEGLHYDDAMLQALQSINKAIGSTAKSLYSVPGLRSGSISGMADVSISNSGIRGLFGKSTQKEIIDSGLLISGTFSQLATSASGLVKAYETVRTTVHKSGFFGIGAKTTVSDSQNFIQVGADVENTISSIFSNAQDLFVAAGEKIGMSASTVISKLNKIDVGSAFASLRGLKGDELEKEFSAVIGNLLDSAANSLFANMEKYREFGEGMLETVIRVVDGAEKVNVALHSIGVSIVNIGTRSFDVTEALIEGAGGLQHFSDQVKYFSDNFLTEAERLAPISENVTKVLGDLGYSSVDTRDEFKRLVQSLDLTTVYGQETYQKLMDISGAFATLYPELKKLMTIEEARKAMLSQTIEILKLQGRTTEALTLQRLEELAAMEDILKPGQLYIYALQDEAAIKAQLKTAYEKESAALKSTISNLKSAIKTLADFRDSLLLSDKSNLTPMQKYEETRRKAMEVAAIANGIAITDAEIQAKNDAINNLPAVSSAFLDASRALFASSDQYNADFQSVLDMLDNTSSALTTQLTTAELQLAALDTMAEMIGLIADSSKTTAELLIEYRDAQAVTALAAANYSENITAITAELLSKAGLTNELMAVMIGIMDPSKLGTATGLIAANTASYTTTTAANAPTMAIPAPPTRATAMSVTPTQAANDALMIQVANLTAEVAGLRADQQNQTGAVIATNYDANKQNAAAVNNTLTGIVGAAGWLARTKFALA
jgi:hypothetical protein